MYYCALCDGLTWVNLAHFLIVEFYAKNTLNTHITFLSFIVVHIYIGKPFSLGVLQHILPRFLVTCAIWCVLEYSFRELSLKKIL